MKKLHDVILEIFLFPIKFYQKEISPRLGPHKCRYVPTCSSYAMEALKEWGIFKGTGLAIWRILRCNHFSKGGYDPVPENIKKREKLAKKQAKQEKQNENKKNQE